MLSICILNSNHIAQTFFRHSRNWIMMKMSRSFFVTLDEALLMVQSGEIEDAKTIIALMMTKQKLSAAK